MYSKYWEKNKTDYGNMIVLKLLMVNIFIATIKKNIEETKEDIKNSNVNGANKWKRQNI